MPDYSYISQLCPEVDLAVNPEEHVCFKAVHGFVKSAVSLNKRIHGQANLELEAVPKGENLLFCCYPSGDLYTWFIDGFNFILIALVNEKVKTLGVVPVDRSQEFMSLVNGVANDINIRNLYPVEEPDNFTPNHGENPPDLENE